MSLEWMLIRGSGLVAYGLLAGATIWGLVLSLGALSRATKSLTFVHESLSVGALLATVVHMVALYLHDYLEFTAEEILVPGTSDWRPVAVAWGGVAFYGMLILTISFYLRKQIGQRQWRLLHFGAFGVFAGGLVHGVMAGTDTSHPVVLGLYVATAAAIVVLTAMRIAAVTGPVAATSGRRTAERPARERATAATPATPRAAVADTLTMPAAVAPPTASQPSPRPDRAAMLARAKEAAAARRSDEATVETPRPVPQRPDRAAMLAAAKEVAAARRAAEAAAPAEA
jgi:hypothetical protein